MSSPETTEITGEQQDRFADAVRRLLPQFDIRELTHPGEVLNEPAGIAIYQLDPISHLAVTEDVPDAEIGEPNSDYALVAYLISVEETDGQTLERSEAFEVFPEDHTASYDLTINVEPTTVVDPALENIEFEPTLENSFAGPEVLDDTHPEQQEENKAGNDRLNRAVRERMLAEELGAHIFTVAHFERIMPLLELCGPHNLIPAEDA